MKAKIKPVNDMAVSDEHLSIIILKKTEAQIQTDYQGILQESAEEGSEQKMNDDEKCCCGNCLHHRPSWETGHLSGWHCDNFMADAYGCDTEYDDGEECPDFESKR